MKIGPTELTLILVLVLILFGAGKLPQVFSQLGKAVKNFKDASTGADDPIDVTPRRQLDLDEAQMAAAKEHEKVASSKS